MFEPSPRRRGKRRFNDDEEPAYSTRGRLGKRVNAAGADEPAASDADGTRWSTWDKSAAGQRGPCPYPPWLITELAAMDTELGVLKTGKEADVFLLRRGLPDGSRSCLLAAKRYRSAEHRMFHRDAAYLEGRRVRQSRDARAMARRTTVGRTLIAEQWASAEFSALSKLFQAGLPVPYPVQVLGTEVLLEFIGGQDGTAAPRLAELRPEGDELRLLWAQLVQALVQLAADGLAHGDLSAYNLLVHDGQLVMIDLPQLVDIITNPRGREFLDRDAANVASWFTARGLTGTDPAPGELAGLLRQGARLG